MTRRLRIALAVATSVLVAGCGAAPEKRGPAGVDGLEIPTPSADPGDFVDGVDNPWLPLTPGSTWVYEATAGDEAAITVTVAEETREVRGVTTTVVHDVMTDADGDVVEETYGWFAQDRAGNVWHFGEDTTTYDNGRADTAGSWEAGLDGARAGVVMLAKPRLGDGYRQELLAGTAEDQATVVSLDGRVVLDLGTYEGTLQTEVTTPLEPGLTVHRYYARDVGLVYQETVAGGEAAAELVEFTPGG